jgi:hypothetical protein
MFGAAPKHPHCLALTALGRCGSLAELRVMAGCPIYFALTATQPQRECGACAPLRAGSAFRRPGPPTR